MKKFAVFAIVTALMLFVAVPGFAATIPIGSQVDSSDIFVGSGNFYGTEGGVALVSSDVIDLKLDDPFNLEFFWGETPSEVDGMFIRTVDESGSVSGSFDIFNVDSVDIDFETESWFGATFPEDSISVSPDSGDLIVSGDQDMVVSWDFSVVEGNRLVYGGYDADWKSQFGGDGYFAIGAIKVETDPTYCVLGVYQVTSSDNPPLMAKEEDMTSGTDALLTPFGSLSLYEFKYLDSFEISNLDENISFTLDRESEGYLAIVLQNWGRNAFNLDKAPYFTFLGEDLLFTKGFIGGAPITAADPSEVGSGISVMIIPGDGEDFTPIANMNGMYSISLGGAGEISFEWHGEDEIITEEDDTVNTSSGGGCSVGFLAPSALLLILPLLFMKRK